LGRITPYPPPLQGRGIITPLGVREGLEGQANNNSFLLGVILPFGEKGEHLAND
jgi:hypothetical protein